MWIKALQAEDQPTWAYFAHDMIPRSPVSTERNISLDIKQNIFLQSFKTKKSSLPRNLQSLLEVANETGLRAEGIFLEKSSETGQSGITQMLTPELGC
ncbi:uncharacterized protein BT62DRAFT_1039469 [Guyanagaster necrorhizus]|uniref:Uncharacterized protein n=1 Tax=Guyanagaster necrorhizus TaxID=856835 RepID=A0A9P7W2K2_9AGAR|nr:uncharacterized protein BT62DRAFT_1039469 [Guyanagaster necrorhizus MCA 3950]KAG7451419.1 hypothetical protein BT62DRAFT_1039469 [Guyanagaster necrorhizus MCA 3950]